jgi:transposase
VGVSDSVRKVRDELWEAVEPLLPAQEPDPRGGRPRVDDRACFEAIMYVMIAGIAWRHLPRELGVSPATAHRRLKEWERAGVWARLHQGMLRRLNAKGAIDWKTGVVDGSHVRALRGGSRWALSG